jgi:lipoprotein-releasing system permease protein
MPLRLPFAWMVCLRYLREGRMQTLLILAGVTGGVAVIIFLTTLISQLQVSIIDKTLGSQAHIVIRPPQAVNLTTLAAGQHGSHHPAPRTAPAQRGPMGLGGKVGGETPGVLAVSPMLSGAGFAVRADASQSIALMGVDAVAFQRIVRMPKYLQSGVFDVDGTHAVIGSELAKDLGIVVGDKLRLVTMDGRNDLFSVSGIFDIGNRDLNRRWVFTSIKVAQSLLDLPGGITQLDLRVEDLFAAEATARLAGANRPHGGQLDADQRAIAVRTEQPEHVQQPDPILCDGDRGGGHCQRAGGVCGAKAEGNRHPARHGREPAAHHVGVSAAGRVLRPDGVCPGVSTGVRLLNFFAKITRNADGTALVSGELEVSMVVSACVLAMVVGLLAAALPARRAARMDPVQAIRV